MYYIGSDKLIQGIANNNDVFYKVRTALIGLITIHLEYLKGLARPVKHVRLVSTKSTTNASLKHFCAPKMFYKS